MTGKISEDTVATTLVGAAFAAAQSGGNVQVPPALLYSHVDAKQYGIVADGTDQLAAFNAMFDAIADGGTDPDGAKVYLPVGIIGLSATLTVPDKVALIGQGRRSTVLKALSGFAESTPVVSLGELSTGTAFDCYLQDLMVDANNVTGSIAVRTTRGQEGAGLRGVNLSNYKTNGFESATAGQSAANLYLVDIECYAGSGATNGILLDTVGGSNLIQRVTVNANATSGIRIKSTQIFGGSFHFEGLTNGLYVDGDNAVCNVHGITSAGTAVTNLVYISSGRRACVGGIVKGTATNALKDDGNGLTLTDTFIQDYGGAKYIGTLIHEPNPVGSSSNAIALDMSYQAYKRVNTLTENTTVGAPTNGIAGMELSMFFTQDGTGGRTVAWNSVFKGVTLASSGTANQKAFIVFRFDGFNWYQVGVCAWVS